MVLQKLSFVNPAPLSIKILLKNIDTYHEKHLSIKFMIYWKVVRGQAPKIQLHQF